MEIEGTLRSHDGVGIVHLEARYDSSVRDVWAALTEPARIARWYGEVGGDLRVGGEITIFVEPDNWRGTGRIEACEAQRHFRTVDRELIESHELGQGVAPFDATLDVTLTDEGAQTLVVAEIAGPPLDKVHFYGVGWQIHAERLGDYLAGGERVDKNDRWPELLPRYEEQAKELR